MRVLDSQFGSLAYKSLGDGKEVFLIFHGFGQDHSDLLPFSKIIKPEQRFLFIDIFYHGKSQWKSHENPLTKSVWAETLKSLFKKEEISKFHLIGYSMGGKFSLLTYELFPENVQSMILLAPDGIKTGVFYSISSYPAYFHALFKQIVFKPRRFFSVVNGLSQIGLVESSISKFVQTQMEYRSQRAQVYFTWKTFGGIQLRLGQIIRNARKLKTPILLFTGKYDKMVTANNLERFSSKIPHLKSHILPVGHGGLIQATVEYLNQEKLDA